LGASVVAYDPTRQASRRVTTLGYGDLEIASKAQTVSKSVLRPAGYKKVMACTWKRSDGGKYKHVTRASAMPGPHPALIGPRLHDAWHPTCRRRRSTRPPFLIHTVSRYLPSDVNDLGLETSTNYGSTTLTDKADVWMFCYRPDAVCTLLLLYSTTLHPYIPYHRNQSNGGTSCPLSMPSRPVYQEERDARGQLRLPSTS
jgi:hypothetical protein